MSQYGCPQCGGPISFMSASFSPYICSTCRAENKRASQAETLDAVRRFEDRTFGLILSPLPAVLRPTLERILSNPRVRGLTKVIGGFGLAALIYLLLYGIGRLTGHWILPANALLALPLAVSMIGWVEVASGIGFADLADRFDRGGILVKAVILLAVLPLIGLYLLAGIWIYRHYS